MTLGCSLLSPEVRDHRPPTAPPIDTNANAWAEIRSNDRGRWSVSVVPLIEGARTTAPNPDSDPSLIMLLRTGDMVAWETAAGRVVCYLKIMTRDGRLFFWPVRLASTMEAAPLSLKVPITVRDGIKLSGEGLRKRSARPITVTVLGRLRDPGPGWAETT